MNIKKEHLNQIYYKFERNVLYLIQAKDNFPFNFEERNKHSVDSRSEKDCKEFPVFLEFRFK